jgi:hypothetical protein
MIAYCILFDKDSCFNIVLLLLKLLINVLISNFHGGDYEEWRLLGWMLRRVAVVRTDVSE